MTHKITDNIDNTERMNFGARSGGWWDESGEFWTLHAINPLRLKYINQYIDLENRKILDVGCGGGILSEAMARMGASVTGIDVSPELIKIAESHAERSCLKIRYQVSTIEELSNLPGERYDVITCMELLEHVPDPLSVIQTCRNLCKPDGDIFFSTINRNPKSYLFAVLAAEYLLKILPLHTHDYRRFIRPSELAGWGRQCGLVIDDFTGIGYFPILKHFYLAKNIEVNYLAHAKPDTAK